MTSIHQDEAIRRHLAPLLLTDADIEYGILIALQLGIEYAESVECILDMKGITDRTLREQVWAASRGASRWSSMWCTIWLERKHGHSVDKILTFNEYGP